MNLPERVLFSAHDPAGAHAIAPVLLACREEGVVLLGLASGPARVVFSGYGLECIDALSLSEKDILATVDGFKPELFLAGTSGGLTIDKKILLHLKDRVRSVYVLDFWNNYWQRFSEKNRDFKYLPDLICVMDEHARQEMLSEGFAPERIRVTGNPYFAHFADAVHTGGEDPHRMLFISQPISDASKLAGFSDYGFDEFDVLRGLQDALKKMPEEYILEIRPHPKEDAHKYDTYVDGRTRLSRERELEADLSCAGLVIGVFSPVLMQAAAAGKQVLSFQPGLVGKDPLPTNRLGLTRRAGSQPELEMFLREYVAGGSLGRSEDVRNLLPADATSRVLEVLATS